MRVSGVRGKGGKDLRDSGVRGKGGKDLRDSSVRGKGGKDLPLFNLVVTYNMQLQ